MAADALTGRAAEVYERVQAGMTPQEIADNLDTTRNSIYQVIGRLRREGHLPEQDGASRAPRRRQTRRPERTHRSIFDELNTLADRCDAREKTIGDEEEQLRSRLDELSDEREEIKRLRDMIAQSA